MFGTILAWILFLGPIGLGAFLLWRLVEWNNKIYNKMTPEERKKADHDAAVSAAVND